MENKKSNTEIIKFSQHITPLPIEINQNRTSEKTVLYGADNLYPNFLLKLYENSPMHKGIVEDKLYYILGDGVVNKATGEKFNPMVNGVDTLEEVVNKIVIDSIIFGYFGIEVIYNALGDPIEFVHIPSHHIRANRSLTMFNVCDDWFTNSRNGVLSYDRWKSGKNTEGKSTLFFYKKYSPSVQNVYPKPEYYAAIKSLETDLAIRDFHLNNITNGFSVSTLITFFGATLPPDQKKAFQDKIEKAYTGSSGAKFIIDFQSKEGTAADVKNISANDWDKAYELVRDAVNQDILVAHTMPSILFGQNQEGKMGGSGVELETAFEKFKLLYVKGKRNELESGLNKLFASAGYPEIEFKDKSSLFSSTISDATKEKVYTIDELRAIEGFEPLPNGAGQKLIQETIKAPEPAKFSISNEPAKNEYYSLTADDFEKVKDLGLVKSDYELIEKSEALESFSRIDRVLNHFDDNDAVNKYLIEKDLQGKTVAEIRTEIKKELDIKITVAEIGDKLAKLKSSGVIDIKITDGTINQTPVDKPKVEEAKPSTPKREVEVLYSYEGVKDDRNRAFCAKILETDKFYTREEIQSMSSIFGYDIFKFRGGWYHNPSTGKDTPFCRHHWHANKVIRKGDSK
jgi:hypothetical protein